MLEERLGYRFRDRNLLLTALTHPSCREKSRGNGDSDNQRLEFLGDAVLGFLAAAALYRRHQNHPEGLLTCIRSRVTNGRMLGRIGVGLGLGDFIRMARGEERMGGRVRASTLADALESVFGAAYLDGGIAATERMFARLFAPALNDAHHDVWAENPKGRLQFLAQRLFREAPVYRVRDATGSRHAPVFTVEVEVHGEVMGAGAGSTKRQAESAAARMAAEKLAVGRDGVPAVGPDA